MALKFLNNGYFAGKVGIGTASPLGELHVKNVSELYTDLDGSDAAVNFLDSNLDAWRIGIRASDNSFRFSQDATSLGTNVRVTIADGGNVGIGNTNPQYPLHFGDVGGYYISIGSGNSTPGGNTPWLGVFNNNSIASATYGWGIYDSSADGSFQIWNRAGNTTGYNTFTIKRGGNVGIGTTSPDARLDVNGGLNSTHAIFSGQDGRGLKLSTENTLNNDDGVVYDAQTSTGKHLFKVSGAEKMRITSAGNVGIGDTTPLSKLEVAGSIKSTNYDTSHTSESGVTLGYNVMEAMAYLETWTSKPLTFRTYNYQAFNISGSEAMRIDTSRNVGIGVTGPSSKLVVAKNINPAITILDTTTIPAGTQNAGNNITFGTLQFQWGAESYSYMPSIEARFNETDASFGRKAGLDFKVGNIGSVTAMSILSDGNVGIGTTAPSYKLDVAGEVRANNLFRTTDGTNIGLFGSSVFASNVIGIGSSNAVPLVLGTSATERMRIDSSGNVGIQNTNPSGNAIGDGGKNLVVGNNANANHSSAISIISGATSGFSYLLFGDGDGAAGYQGQVRYSNGDNSLEFVTSQSERMNINSTGAVKFNAYDSTNQTGTPTYLLGTDGSGNIVKTLPQGSGTAGPYLPLAGGTMTGSIIQNGGNIDFSDGRSANFGNGDDLQIYHDGSNSYIDNTTNDLYIRSTSDDVIIQSADDVFIYTQGGEDAIIARGDGVVELYYDNTKKLSTGSVSVGTATTIGGTLIDGWKTTTQANAINDTTIATTAYVNNKIQLIPAGLVFQGTWDARTAAEGGAAGNKGNPALTSGVGTTGNFYIVSNAGSVNLDGITDWKVGDWAVFIEQGASDQWEKIDNSSVLDGFGTGQTVPLWAGSGTSNTLDNSIITQTGSSPSQQIRITSENDAQLRLDGGTTLYAGIHWFDVSGNDYMWFNGSSGTFAIGGGGSGVSGKKLHIDGSTSIGSNYDAASPPTNGLVVEGNVGIGTTSPNEKLDVQGKIYIESQGVDWNETTPGLVRGALHFDPVGSGADNTGNAITFGASDSSVGTNANAGIYTRSDGAYGTKMYFATTDSYALGSKTRMMIDYNGNFGIGTTSPDAILETSKEVDGNQVGALLTNTRQTGTADSVSLNFGLGRTADGYIRSVDAIKLLKEQQWTGTVSTVDAALVFSTVQNETVSERARITSTGHLQVSTGYFELTSQPTTKLWLTTNQAQLYAGGLLVFAGYNSSNDAVVVGNETGDVNVTLAGGANDKVLYLEGSSGNVGIGTKTPQSKLQVAGGIQMADDTDTASATKVGTMRYRTGTEYIDVTGTDLVTNGDFATDTNWTKGTGVTIASGVGTWTNTANNVGLTQLITFTANAYYRCNVTVSNYSSGSFRFRYPGISSPRITANGTYSLIIQANQATNDTLYLQGETNGDTNVNFSIDNVSVVEVTAEDASYADMCMQTGASTYEWVNIVRNTY